MTSLGVEAQSVSYPFKDKSGIMKKVFTLENDPKFYVIKKLINETRFNQYVYTYKDEEVPYGPDGIFTYRLGSQCNVDVANKTISRNLSNDCDLDRMHIWTRPSLTVQEINTKHMNILTDSDSRYDEIINSFNNNIPIDNLTLYNGIIDQIFYAGELHKNGNQATINFLSGTYMTGVISCSSPSPEVIECITNFFRKLNMSCTVDTSCKTLITDPMTREMLDAHIRAGDLEVYVFDSEADASGLDTRELKISRLLGKKAMVERQAARVPSEQLTKQLSDLQTEYDRLVSITGTRYVPENMRGGMKSRRRRFRRHLKRKTNRRRR